MLDRRLERRDDEVELGRWSTASELLAMQRAVEDVHVSEAVGRYMVALVGATRRARASRSARARAARWR